LAIGELTQRTSARSSSTNLSRCGESADHPTRRNHERSRSACPVCSSVAPNRARQLGMADQGRSDLGGEDRGSPVSSRRQCGQVPRCAVGVVAVRCRRRTTSLRGERRPVCMLETLGSARCTGHSTPRWGETRTAGLVAVLGASGSCVVSSTIFAETPGKGCHAEPGLVA